MDVHTLRQTLGHIKILTGIFNIPCEMTDPFIPALDGPKAKNLELQSKTFNINNAKEKKSIR